MLRRLAGLGAAAADGAHAGVGRMPGWAGRRSLVPNSLAGISLLLALSAAAWFSGGSAADNLRGTLLLAGWYLASRGARLLSDANGRRAGGRLRSAGLPAGSTDWLAPYPAGTRAAGPALAAANSHRSLLAICAVCCEYAVYGGISAGGLSAGWPGMWPLTLGAIGAVAVREAIRASSGADAAADQSPADRLVPDPRVADQPAADRAGAGHEGAARFRAGARRVVRRGVRTARAAPAAGRLLLASVALLVHGPRVAIFAVLAWSAGSVCVTLTRRPGFAAAGQPAVLAALRDDGAIVRWAGRLVRGNLMPLPGALAGLAATAMLAISGMDNMIGIVKLAPPVVMLLAAPGSSHRHDGRFDWLAPVVMQAGQYLYLAALGLSSGVPALLIFLLCALTAIRSAVLVTDSTASGQPPASGQLPAGVTAVGWEGRMISCGLGAMLGIATFGYAAVSAYLGVLICRRIATGYLISREDLGR